MKVVAVINQKGGVGKTTTTTNLCHALAQIGYKVTAIDFDPQGQLAISLGVTAQDIGGIDEAMLEKKTAIQQVIRVRNNLALVPAGSRLKDIEQLLDSSKPKGLVLKTALGTYFADQDYVFIDCPPSSGFLIANALVVADQVLVPMTGDFLSLQGLSHLMGTIRRFEKALKRKYKLAIVISRFASTRRMAKQVLNIVLTHFPKQVLATIIREASALAECPSFGQTILEYSPNSRPASDFRDLAEDFLKDRVMIYGNE